MSSLGSEQILLSNPSADITKRLESREGSTERKVVAKERDDKLKVARERQHEERQRKIEELKAQAEAAQKYREQKEEERRRRIEEIRHRDSEKRQQVEERKKAIMEAEKERREYILKKNQERESRLELKKRDRNSFGYAFGSSTPRLLEPADFSMVSSSTFWGQRRSTSISNVAGATTTSRRSSERELNDGGIKQRATSVSDTERHDEDGVVNTSPIVFRSVARRKTDLMPTIPSPREGQYGSRSSLSTPRTPGRAYSMNRLDQLAQPVRRNGEHIRAIMERERREQMEMIMDDGELSLGDDGVRRHDIVKRKVRNSKNRSDGGSMSRSMTHLANGGTAHLTRPKYNIGGGISTSVLPLVSGSKIASKSMVFLGNGCHNVANRSNIGLQTAATKKYLLQESLISCTSNKTKRDQLHYNTTITPKTSRITTTTTTTNPYRFDTNSLLLMKTSSLHLTSGSRSGNVTPGGHNNSSRPGSAMSTSTTLSTSGLINKRSGPVTRKARPASIAGTGVSLEAFTEVTKLKKDAKPPSKPSTGTHLTQTTPKRSSNIMSTSLIVSSSTRLFTPEKKVLPVKKDSVTPKASTPRSLSKSASSDRLNKFSKDKAKDAAPKSPVTTTKPITNGKENKEIIRNSKEEKEHINQVKTVEILSTVTGTALGDNQAVISNENYDENGANSDSASRDEEKADVGSEKEKQPPINMNLKTNVNQQQFSIDNNKANTNATVQELNTTDGDSCTDVMTASMIAKNKITTEEEAKAALAERRRLAREEAERQAELERQRIEAERLAEIRRQEEEAERQRQFEEEAMRLAEEQRKAEEERLRQAIEEAKQREEAEKRRREEEERQRLEREEAEKKAKEEAEKQRIEVAERLKREEKEREERRKRVEAIMSRTRRSGINTGTPNSTPTKENNSTHIQKTSTDRLNNLSSTNIVTNTAVSKDMEANSVKEQIENPTIPSAISTDNTSETNMFPTFENSNLHSVAQNSQCLYEQTITNKENSLMNCFSNLIINENAKNIQQQQQQQQQLQNQFMADQQTHPIKLVEIQKSHEAISNGNSNHVDIMNNKNENDLINTVTVSSTNQLLDITFDSHDNIHIKNNNSLLSTATAAANTATLVTADSHENKDISML